jgi:hypothetical protein
VASGALLFPAVGWAVGPDGANHTSDATAYGPITSGTTYAASNAFSDDVDIYAVHSYLPNVNLVIDFQDDYSGGSTDCTFFTSCSLEVVVRDANGNEIDPVGGYYVEPGQLTPLVPVTLPTAGTYYIDVGTSEYNVTGALGGQDIPYDFVIEPALGLAVVPPAPPAPTPVTPTPVTPTPAPPACIVPGFHSGAKLGPVEQQIAARHCALGHVRLRYNRRVKRGQVLALSPRPRTHLSYGAAVSIVVSAGPKPKSDKRRGRT